MSAFSIDDLRFRRRGDDECDIVVYGMTVRLKRQGIPSRRIVPHRRLVDMRFIGRFRL